MMGVGMESLSVLDMVPIGLFVLDRDLVIQFWNRTLETWTGLSREEMVGHQLKEQYPHLLEPRYAGRLEDVFQQGTPAVFSSQLHPEMLPVTLPGGRRQHQKVTVTAIPRDGKIRWALVAIEDVTDLVEQVGLHREMRDRALEEVGYRRQKEAELQRRNRELSIMHAATTAITSPARLRERLSNVLNLLLSYTGFEAGMIHLFEHEDPDGALVVQTGLLPGTVEEVRSIWLAGPYLDLMKSTEKGAQEEVRTALLGAVRKEAWRDLLWIPLTAEERPVGCLMFLSERECLLDREEREVIESIICEIGTAVGKALVEARLKDAHAQANLYLDILMHDVGNTVTTIGAASELLALQLEKPSPGALSQIQRGIAKVNEIIRNVSTIRQIHEQDKTPLCPIRLDELVRTEMEVFVGARIINEVPPCEVLADRLLGEVFTNLIGNSLKHGGRDVTIWIRARPTEGGIECSVEDDGPGIPEEKKRHLFERFETGQGERSGHGLGLYIVSSLVRRYGGSCRVVDRIEGHPEAGTAVRFTLLAGGNHVPVSPPGDGDWPPERDGIGNHRLVNRT
ncbi:MAG TPA: PAS domain-containing sensor histidine kinase [Methanoregulaceae archaeon]|nr:PAS domain-containing sensor histidine kinase [Methanoregulaceae archaeon]